MKRIGGWILGIYVLYLFKSAIGINISQSQTAPDWMKLPIAPILKARDSNPFHG